MNSRDSLNIYSSSNRRWIVFFLFNSNLHFHALTKDIKQNNLQILREIGQYKNGSLLRDKAKNYIQVYKNQEGQNNGEDSLRYGGSRSRLVKSWPIFNIFES